LLQRQLAAALEIDTPMYSKIERVERQAKRTQMVAIAKLLSTDENELLTLWLADKIVAAVDNKNELALDALNTAQQHILKK